MGKQTNYWSNSNVLGTLVFKAVITLVPMAIDQMHYNYKTFYSILHYYQTLVMQECLRKWD